MMKDIIESFRAIGFDDEGFNVSDLPGYRSYQIGIDSSNNIVFLIKPIDSAESLSANSSRGRHLDILLNTECEVTSNGKTKSDAYTILILKTLNEFFETIFLNICADLIEILGDKPRYSEVIYSVEALRELFRKSMNPSSTQELGLWGEMFIIEASGNKELLIDSWHINPKDTFDFNDGLTKLEIKTTIKNERVHVVKLNQVIKARDSGSLICSLMTSEIDRGKSIKDLYNSISNGVNPSYKFKLNEKLMAAAGANLEGFVKKFDYKTASVSKLFFDSKDIPCIDRAYIDQAITDVSYSVSLENVDPWRPDGRNSHLLNALI